MYRGTNITGCVNTSLNQNLDKPKFLRYLLEETKCINYETQIIEGNKKLNEIFKLNISGIHAMIYGLLVLIIISFSLLGLILIFTCGAICGTFCCGEKAALILVPCYPIIAIVSFGSAIASLVLNL